jgi:RND superfamily putative drug exporter
VTVLTRLVRSCATHPWRTIGIWIAVVLVIFASAGAFGGKLVNNSTIPGSDSQEAVDLLTERFPERAGDSARIVFSFDEGLDTAEGHQAVEAAQAAVAEIPGVIAVGDPYTGQGGALSEGGDIGFLEAQFDRPARELESSQIEAVERDVRAAVGDSDVQVEFGGTVIGAKAVESHTSEALGFAAAIIVLLIVLGTAVAMALPMTLAIVAIGTGMSLLLLAAAVADFNTTTPILAVMIGLGVAIDYSLFIVMRFRQELAKGRTPREAATIAGSTAGRAVVFAGATVAISISGLALVGIPFVAKMGYGTAIAVIVAVVTAVTLMPALLATVGHRIDRLRMPWARRRREPRPDRGISRVARIVERRPKTVLFATLAVVLTMAIPVLSLNMGTADAGTNPPGTTTRKAYDLLAEGFGAGFNGPLLVAVDQGDDPGATQELAKAFAETPGVAAVTEPGVNEAGDTAQIAVFPSTAPQSSETADLVHTLRDDVIPATLAGSSATAHVGGETAANEDVAEKIISSIPLFLAFVVGVIFLLMTMAFRSVVVALKAAVTTLLSALAAFGALVAVFEWGWLQGLVGLDTTGPTASFLPVIVLSILFGLAMDYEVFLASRIREEYVKGGDAHGSITRGVKGVGRVIVAAAIIMGVVFWAFVLSDDRTVKSFGLGLGVAILVDALIIRMLMVPAIMHLLGRRAWYIPRWLDRILPNLTIEPPDEDEGGEAPAPELPELPEVPETAERVPAGVAS